jgi:hypothetical protein
MDCEQINDLANQGGPITWDLGERAIRGYCETLLAAGLKATLFVVPQGTTPYRRALLDLSAAGIEVGLHYHPQDHGYRDFFGAFDGEEQEQMLRPAIASWSQDLGRMPQVFRPGNFSANDATFPLLAQLGFLAGGVSCPLRNFTDARANWVGAVMDPHFTHRANRLLAGDLPFFEVPMTVDWESIMWGGRTALELRIEMVDARSHGYTIRKAVKRQLDAGMAPVIVVLTHNIFDYGSTAEFRRTVLDGIIAEIRRAAEAQGLTVQPATLMELRTLYSRVD